MNRSAKKKAPKINAGTIVAIPLGNGKFAFSQVYTPGVTFYLVVYDGIREIDEVPSFSDVKIILASWTNDAEIYRGRWIVIGNASFEALVVEPEYRVLIAGKEMVESFDGKIHRAVGPQDSSLKNRKSRSPLIVEDAVRAFYGLADRPPSYDDMLVFTDDGGAARRAR